MITKGRCNYGWPIFQVQQSNFLYNSKSPAELLTEHISRYPKVAKVALCMEKQYLLFTHSSLSSLLGNKTKGDKNWVLTSVQIVETKLKSHLCLTDGYYQTWKSSDNYKKTDCWIWQKWDAIAISAFRASTVSLSWELQTTKQGWR